MLKIGILLGCLAIVAILVVSWTQHRRRSVLEQAGLTLGLRYEGKATAAEDAGWRALPAIAARQRNFFSHVLRGGEAAVFDWTWREGPLKERRRGSQTVVAFRRSGRILPVFVWTARGEFAKTPVPGIGEPMTFSDDPAFADRYDLVGPDRESLRALFDPARRAQLSLPEGVRVEAAGEWVIGFQRGRILGAVELDRLFEATRAISEVLVR